MFVETTSVNTMDTVESGRDGSVRSPTLLIVDSDEAGRDAIVRAVRERGFEIMTAASGGEGVELARRFEPRIVLVAHQLADMPATRLLDVLRHDVALGRTQVVVVGPPHAERAARNAGASEFLAAPVETPRLVQCLLRRLGPVGDADEATSVLLIDDDEACRELARRILEDGGYRVAEAASGREALALIEICRPDVVVLDVVMPGDDGVAVLGQLRADARFRHVPVIFVTALGGISDKLRALKAGGDDYLVKPYDGRELAARVELTLRKARERESMSPNTLLPGTQGIALEVGRRNERALPFAFCYVDVDNFKAFNDNYGYVRADAVIRQLADTLRTAVASHGDGDELLGHIAGDDFVLVARPETAVAVLERALSEFDSIVPFHYDPVDREKGYIVAEDRFGTLRRFPLMSLSAVALWCEPGPSCDYVRISDDAAALKKRAKKIPGSLLLKDWE